MSKKCNNCGCGVMPVIPQGMYYCPRCNKDKSEKDVSTVIVFDIITESVGTLARNFVYEAVTCDGDGHVLSGYRSTIIRGFWLSKEEAITAVTKELKKEWKRDE